MDTKVERAVGDEVWHHKHPWVGRRADQGKKMLWGSDGDERHVSGVDGC
jgi:hypothetical protein